MCGVLSLVKACGHEMDRITILINGVGIFIDTMFRTPFGAYNTNLEIISYEMYCTV
jgi:hypothetical protein